MSTMKHVWTTIKCVIWNTRVVINDDVTFQRVTIILREIARSIYLDYSGTSKWNNLTLFSANNEHTNTNQTYWLIFHMLSHKVLTCVRLLHSVCDISFQMCFIFPGILDLSPLHRSCWVQAKAAASAKASDATAAASPVAAEEERNKSSSKS